MRIKIRREKLRLCIPAPLSLARLALRLLPRRALQHMRRGVPAPYDALLTRENLRMLLRGYLDAFKGYRRLEIVHVEAADGTFISVRL